MSAKKSAKKTARKVTKKAARKVAKKTVNKGGRPKKEVDARLVEQLASIGCTMGEIAAAADCSVDTLERRFADVIAKGQENGKTRLRKKQIEVALAGNVSMLIWLGKQMLGQAEKVEAKTEHSGQINGTLDPDAKKAVEDWAKNIQRNIKKQRRGGK